MKAYLDLLRDVIANGVDVEDRTGVGTRSIFGRQVRFDLAEGFPLLTTKRVHWHSVVGELLWFLSGSTDNRDLQARGVTIWNEWAKENGDLGPIYGKQWRDFGGFLIGGSRITGTDQIREVIGTIQNNPNSRRLVVSAWNPEEIADMALPPCHMIFQFSVRPSPTGLRLSCHLNMRSCDVFLGLPFNVASYALLTHMVAHVTDLDVGELVISFGDLHLYRNHFEQAAVQLEREPRPLPQLAIAGTVASIDDFRPENFDLLLYDPHPGIKAPVAV